MSEMERLSMMRAGGMGNVVRVTLPHDVYFSLDKFQQVQKDILGKLGCRACCSGWDIRFDLERHFLVDSALNVKAGLPGF